MYLTGTRWEEVDSVKLAQYVAQQRPFVDTLFIFVFLRSRELLEQRTDCQTFKEAATLLLKNHAFKSEEQEFCKVMNIIFLFEFR